MHGHGNHTKPTPILHASTRQHKEKKQNINSKINQFILLVVVHGKQKHKRKERKVKSFIPTKTLVAQSEESK